MNHNPFMNNIAQLVECVHVALDSINLIGEFLDTEWDEPRQAVRHKEGVLWSGAVEVPRGFCTTATNLTGPGKS